MNPDQPGQNPYDFILAPPKAPAPKVFLPGGNSKGGKIALIAGGGIVLIMLVVVVVSLFNKPDPSLTAMTSLAETQQEVNRITSTGDTITSQQTLKNSSWTIELTMLTQQNKTLAYLTTHHIKISIAQLASKKSTTTDTQLKTATQNSTYDIVYAQVMQRELQGYATELKTDYSTVTGVNAKALIKSYYADTQKLITQLAANTPANPDASPAP